MKEKRVLIILCFGDSESKRSGRAVLVFLAIASTCLQDFLTQQKKHVLPPKQQTQHWVIGDEARDADSITSAITLAYIESTTTTTTTSELAETTDSVRKTPIVSISQSDLQSQRPETTLLLQQGSQIELDSLWYVDQLEELLSLSSYSNDKQQCDTTTIAVDLTLVDHNSLNTAILPKTLLQNEKKYLWKVVKILDHHLDEGQHTGTCPVLPTTTTGPSDIGSSSNRNQRRTIAFENGVSTAAFTCTLIVEHLQEIMELTNPPQSQQ